MRRHPNHKLILKVHAVHFLYTYLNKSNSTSGINLYIRVILTTVPAIWLDNWLYLVSRFSFSLHVTLYMSLKENLEFTQKVARLVKRLAPNWSVVSPHHVLRLFPWERNVIPLLSTGWFQEWIQELFTHVKCHVSQSKRTRLV